MSLSAPDLAIWRTAPYSVYFDAWIHSPPTIFSARVNMASAIYPIDTIVYDTVTFGSYADIEEETLLLLGSAPGLSDYGRQRIHKDGSDPATSTKIFVGRSSQGTHDGELNVVDNCYLTVIELRAIWAEPPWIDAISNPDNPPTYKDGIYGFNTAFYFMPVAIMGGDRLKKASSIAGTASFDFDCSASYTTHPDAIGGITALQWYVKDGTITSGTNTSPTITVSFPVGRRYVQLAVQDSLGNITNAWRLVVVTYPGDPNLISKFTIPSGTKRADGHTISLQVSSAIPFDTHPDGTEVLIRQRERYGAAQTGSLPVGQADAEDMWFSGWLQSEQNSGEASKKGFIARSVITLLDAAGRLKTLPGFPQVVDRKAAFTRWEQMKAANIDRYVWYVLWWHSNALRRCDFFWSGTLDTYGFSTLGSDGKSLWDQASERTQAIAYALTCDKNGRLWMLPDPQLAPTAVQVSTYSLPIAARNDTPLLGILTSDWSSYRYTYTRPPRAHWNRGNAIQVTTVDADSLTDIPTLFCVAPGLSPNQGLSEQTSGAQLAISQAELNCREGNRIATRMNNLFSYLETDIRPGDAGYDPALMRYLSFTIDSATAGPRGRTLSAPNFLPIEINYSYDAQKGLRKPTLTLEAEDPVGQVAVLDPQPQVNQNQIPPQYPPFTPPPLVSPNTNILGRGTANLALFDMTNSAEWLLDLRPVTPSPSEVLLSGLTGWAGTLVQFILNAFAPTNGVVISTTKAFQFLDLGASPSLANAHSFAFTTSQRSMQSERKDNGFFVVVSYREATAGGSRFDVDVTFDGGATWTQHTSVAALGTFVGGAGDSLSPGCYVSAHVANKVFTSGFTGAGVTTGAIFVSTDGGATWSRFNSSSFTNLASDMTIPYPDSSEATIYHGGTVAVSGHTEYRLYKATSSSQTDISPTGTGGHQYGPGAPFSIKACDVDARSLLLCGIDNDVGGSSTHRAVFLSRDGGATWTEIVTAGTSVPYTSGCFAGDDPNTIFLWGVSGALAVSYDGGRNFQDKSVVSAGTFANIAGLA